MAPSRKYTFLQVNIGRGHPFYLDGIIERMRVVDRTINIEEMDAESLSTGISKAAWKSVRRLYEHGSSGGMIGAVYARLRRGGDYRRQRLARAILGRDIRRRLLRDSSPLIVSHPLLVAILAGRPNLIYQHGELIAPGESRVLGASTVLVPTEPVAELFRNAGYSHDQIVVTGLCVEPGAAAVAEEAYQKRISRLSQKAPLTGLVVSSGAEPQQHIRAIISSITSCRQEGVRTLALARMGGRLENAVRRLERSFEVDRETQVGPWRDDSVAGECRLVACQSRRDESEALTTLLPEIDFFVGPPHERTNWALGLGLPMFVLTPCIGPFAPLNFQLLKDSGTAVPIESIRDASALGGTVLELRNSGRLARMAECGWGKHPIDGFERIARILTGVV